MKSKTTVAVAALPEALTICNASWNEKNSVTREPNDIE